MYSKIKQGQCETVTKFTTMRSCDCDIYSVSKMKNVSSGRGPSLIAFKKKKIVISVEDGLIC